MSTITDESGIDVSRVVETVEAIKDDPSLES
jgi:hypothetical protein